MLIKHDVYSQAAVQSLGVETAGKKRPTVGVVLPGTHDLGIAEHTETLCILHGGAVLVNGHPIQPAFPTVEIRKGSHVAVQVKYDPVYYICYYQKGRDTQPFEMGISRETLLERLQLAVTSSEVKVVDITFHDGITLTYQLRRMERKNRTWLIGPSETRRRFNFDDVEHVSKPRWS